jgi:D-beta-D-heptose 7-phosphate kinase/D-beta-D-heptose 1-phosphate adenosyltransferase
LGVKTSLIGHIAPDEAGLRVSDILSGSGVNVITNDNSDAPTIIKTRIIVRNQQLCRIDREVSRELYRIDNAPGFYTLLEQVLTEVDAVIISDYAKGVITQSLVDFVLKKAENTPLLIAIDPKPANKLLFSGAGLLTPNRQEALELAGITQAHHDDDYPLEEVCNRIYKIYSPKLLVITLGAEGMAICKNGEVQAKLATEAQEVFDVSGAGDTVIATLTAALASGIDPQQSAWLANGAAGCVVAHMGTVPVNRDELKQWLEEHPEKDNN